MHQVWHIFRKDVRHRWREILVLFALLIVYGWYEVRSWSNFGFGAYGIGSVWGIFGQLPRLTRILVPISWLFLAIRAVQDESLVGDRQFWITRPYEWKKLLAAKLLFALLFINLPLLVLQIVLLRIAQFSPLNHLPGMMSVQLGMILVVILPVLALSSVTATIAQFALGLIILVLYLAGVAYISGLVPSSSFGDPAETVQFFLFFLTIIAVILLQYSRRYTTKSRLLLAALAMVILIIVVIAPYRWFVDREYPPLSAGQTSPVQFSLRQLSSDEKRQSFEPGGAEQVSISIPLQTSELASDSIVVLKGKLVTIESANGIAWNSGWIPESTRIYPDRKEVTIGFELKKKLFEQLKALPVKLKVSFAYELYRDEDRRDFVTPAGQFLLPELGRCISDTYLSGAIHCRTALPRHINLLTTADLSNSTCPLRENQTRATPGIIARNWESRDSGGPDLALTPIENIEIYLSDWERTNLGNTLTGICPGTPLALSHPRLLSKAQHSVELNNIRLADYQLRAILFSTSTGLSLDVP